MAFDAELLGDAAIDARDHVRARETRARVGASAARRRRVDGVPRARAVRGRRVVRTMAGTRERARVRDAKSADVGDVRPRRDVGAHRWTGDVRESHKRHLARTVDGGDDRTRGGPDGEGRRRRRRAEDEHRRRDRRSRAIVGVVPEEWVA